MDRTCPASSWVGTCTNQPGPWMMKPLRCPCGGIAFCSSSGVWKVKISTLRPRSWQGNSSANPAPVVGEPIWSPQPILDAIFAAGTGGAGNATEGVADGDDGPSVDVDDPDGVEPAWRARPDDACSPQPASPTTRTSATVRMRSIFCIGRPSPPVGRDPPSRVGPGRRVAYSAPTLAAYTRFRCRFRS